MNQISELIDRVEAYALQSNLAVSTVSRKLFKDGKTINRLKSGCSCTVKTLEDANVTLSRWEREAT